MMDKYPYLKMVGSLIHSIVNSRLDCAFSINNLHIIFPMQEMCKFKLLKILCNISKEH